ncbi:MAG TPA: hypothetical protein VGM87_07265, partial [Roseomonas sp.]
MAGSFDFSGPLQGARFGGRVGLAGGGGAAALVEAAERDPGALPRLLDDGHGLLLLAGKEAMAEKPELLLR